MIYLPNRRLSQTHVARQFSSASPVRAKMVPDPCPIRPETRMPTLRLAFNNLTDKKEISIAALTDSLINSSLKGTILFPDTCFVTTPIQRSFWRAAHLLSLGFPQMIVRELTGWSLTPFGNEYLHTWLPRALKTCESESLKNGNFFRFCRVLGMLRPQELVHFEVAVAERARFERYGYTYYVNLLSLRKRLGIVACRELAATMGREPTDSELKQYLHNKCHPRVASIAFKGCRDYGKRNYLADEELVVTAVMTAILTGRETVILTRDTDVFDQFVKLMELMLEDYQCHRWANVHFRDPKGCPMYPIGLPPGSSNESGFSGKTFKTIVVPIEEVERLPPYEFKFVNTYCVLVGGDSSWESKVSLAGCCLEREMGYLLDVKGITGGRNTQHFGIENVVARTKAEDKDTQVMFFLGEERYADYEGVRMSSMDLRRGLSSDVLVTKTYFRPSELKYPVS